MNHLPLYRLVNLVSLRFAFITFIAFVTISPLSPLSPLRLSRYVDIVPVFPASIQSLVSTFTYIFIFSFSSISFISMMSPLSPFYSSISFWTLLPIYTIKIISFYWSDNHLPQTPFSPCKPWNPKLDQHHPLYLLSLCSSIFLFHLSPMLQVVQEVEYP